MSIEVKKISKSYDTNLVLNNINFNVAKGEILGLLGINGAGKSTMLKMICSYIQPNSGQIFICKKNIEKYTKYTKQKLGYLSENNPLYEDMYVIEFLRFISNIYNLKESSINNVIEQTGLKSIKNKKIKILSAGQKKRIGIAQAIIHNPEVIILDEPTATLDPNQKQEIHNLIKKLGKNKAILFSTHILEEAEKICDRIIIIHKGNVIANKKTNEFNNRLNQIFKKLTN
tara:strand:- start:828 stop:1514 length:687 start_codon:yes stop_codon:yes gene_type:complete